MQYYPGYFDYCGTNTGRTQKKENAWFSGWHPKGRRGGTKSRKKL
jgi:hypothetical protein